MVHAVTSSEELKKEINDEKNKDKLIVIDFFATWCGPCVRIAPKIEDWSTGDFKDVLFLKCDVDQVEELSTEYKVEAMPTFVFIKNGEEIHRIVGASIDQIQSGIESHRK
ncbi:unnamed protein product [Rotaria sp. Silwood1]|nr:unnamed protein product [Rotaria sp. Silwood1]CAF0762664.1 unnamed protein product [Rotaria sp. Silwood1]CAF3325438.1 unnamed protein product [Rotaria sp. Silwood1]CAF3339247.1 unnamed protein product [Rotaria sp. Silwood1]CAF3343016.1 unnamed protein product [Rotaria sp. Silwood1]